MIYLITELITWRMGAPDLYLFVLVAGAGFEPTTSGL
jgi:hypothetical protein